MKTPCTAFFYERKDEHFSRMAARLPALRPVFRRGKYLIFSFLQKNTCSYAKICELCKTFDGLNPAEYRH